MKNLNKIIVARFIGITITAFIIGLPEIFLLSTEYNYVPFHTENDSIYSKLNKEIGKMKKWNIQDFNNIKDNITKYADNKLINESKEKSLKGRLTTKYLNLISDTVTQFLKKGTGKNNELDKLKGEVELFKKDSPDLINDIMNKIKLFEDALKLKYDIRGYVEIRKYNKTKTDNYNNKINKLENKKFIKDNNYIQKEFEKGRKLLSRHKRVNTLFNEKISDTRKKIGNNSWYCDSEVFILERTKKHTKYFEYYKNECKKIKKELDSIKINKE